MSILTIPKELQVHIIGLLPVRERLRLSETCHGLRDVVRDPSLWKKLVLSFHMIMDRNKACRDHVARCSHLRELVITYHPSWRSFRSDKIMSVVMKAKNILTLTTLSVGSLDLSNSSFKKISKLTQLTKLDIYANSIKSDGFSTLANLTKLRSLKISALDDGYNGHATSKDVVDVFSILKQLEEIDIRSCWSHLGDEVIESLVRNNPNLQVVKINTYGYFFQVQDPKISSQSLNFIAENCPQLTHIEIGSHRVFKNADIIDLISKCSKLKHANFEKTQIEDSSLARLALGCPDLEYLKLSGCHEITGNGIEAFLKKASQAKLKHLDIRGCGFPPSFMERLKQKHPKIDFVMES